MTKPFSVIIPAYNEAEAIYKTVLELKEFLERNYPNQYEIIVVNDGSTDETEEILKKITGINVITHHANRGYGASIKNGVKNSKYDWILLYDGDGQHNTEYLKELIEKTESSDMIIGERIGYKGPLLRQPGKKMLKWIAQYLTEQKIPDINSGLRIFEKRNFNQFKHLLPNGFSITTTLTMSFLTSGLGIVYIPIKIEKRNGKSTVRYAKHGIQTILLILRIIMLFNPLKIFLPISFILACGAIAVAIPTIINYASISKSGVILAVSAVIVFSVGLLADQISSIRREDIKN